MLFRAFALILTLSLSARAQSLDATGQLAALDADAKALDSIRASLVTLPAVKKLGISDSELAAYLAGVVDMPAVPSQVSTADLVLKLENAFQ